MILRNSRQRISKSTLSIFNVDTTSEITFGCEISASQSEVFEND